MQLDDGKIVWSIRSEDFVTNEINNLEEILENYVVAPLKVFGNKYGEWPLPVSYRTK